jgi:hypothetical protein
MSIQEFHARMGSGGDGGGLFGVLRSLKAVKDLTSLLEGDAPLQSWTLWANTEPEATC